MRWPWSRHEGTGGEQAREDAADSLRDVQEQWPEVMEVAASLRELRQRNHFAEVITHIMRGQS